ncbi:MAG: SIS domain-containing protein, partial [Bacillota bacterium]|nr:SIS domain-containing protein [Bacillota bacterium]
MHEQFACMESKILFSSTVEESNTNSIGHIEKYLLEVKNEILKTMEKSRENINDFAEAMKQAMIHGKETMFLGMQQDCHTISHACADYIKFNRLRALHMDVPEMTAFGNDYPYPRNYVETLRHRDFGEGNVLICIQLGNRSKILKEALDYNFHRGGINILITNQPETCDNVHTAVFISSKNIFISSDIVQLIFHYVSAHLAYETDPDFHDEGAKSFNEYCGFLLQSIENSRFSCEILSSITLSIRQKLMSGNSVYAFGNGGSSAIASYFVDELREIYKGSLKAYSRVHDITSLKGLINSCIHHGSYKSDVFTKILDRFGINEGDVLLGVSSSGNSENVVHPFKNFPKSVRIGILGLQD